MKGIRGIKADWDDVWKKYDGDIYIDRALVSLYRKEFKRARTVSGSGQRRSVRSMKTTIPGRRSNLSSSSGCLVTARIFLSVAESEL